MQLDMEKIKFLVGNQDILNQIEQVPSKKIFEERVIEFLYDLSRQLLSGVRYREYIDIISYGFWIRKANILKEKERFEKRNFKMGKGITFHVAPSNVPVNFAVSMTSALLAGNACIIRVSNKEYPQVDIITREMNQLLQKQYSDLQKYICIIRYDHDDNITEYFSQICDLRIVWGGNRTIQYMRQFSLKPRATELTFADRHSIAIINAEQYLQSDISKVADLFYTDTYYSDQNACSSPKMIVWVGGNIEKAKSIFWNKLKEKVEQEYTFSPVMAIDKLEAFTKLAMTHKNVHKITDENLCVRVELEELSENLMDYKMYGGYFFEYYAEKLAEILPVLTKECQTISYLGINPDEIIQLVCSNGCRGVDRIVPVGHTMDLSFTWDGYDMVDTMSRYIMQ